MNGDARIVTKGSVISRPMKVAMQSTAKTVLFCHDMVLSPVACRGSALPSCYRDGAALGIPV